jgi:hypothetical protein
MFMGSEIDVGTASRCVSLTTRVVRPSEPEIRRTGQEISEEENYDNYKDNSLTCSVGEIGGTSSLSLDASIDSLALKDHDHIEDVKKRS